MDPGIPNRGYCLSLFIRLTDYRDMFQTEQNWPQILESNSVPTLTEDGDNQHKCEIKEGLDERAVDDDENEYEQEMDEKAPVNRNRANVDPKRACDEKKRYKCKQCHYATNNNNNLIVHMRAHTGEKPFKCRFCQFATSYSSHLYRHQRTQRHLKAIKEKTENTAKSKKNASRNVRKKSGKKA
ncbi:zinc-finger double domain-containing protein [Ditylenchus destructor]|uniref:Zinc-finger double domain-containing protein n=1 Tax=Ditylenchus destructor TaxID=166010 RepID=A0AAD4MER4_9BILA|nr:zinc-finger double domain-containing protein [Ditylenchus destructor]